MGGAWAEPGTFRGNVNKDHSQSSCISGRKHDYAAAVDTTAATTAVATTSVPAALACALALSFWLSAAEGIMLGEVLYA